MNGAPERATLGVRHQASDRRREKIRHGIRGSGSELWKLMGVGERLLCRRGRGGGQKYRLRAGCSVECLDIEQARCDHQGRCDVQRSLELAIPCHERREWSVAGSESWT